MRMSRERASQITHETLDRYLNHDMNKPIEYRDMTQEKYEWFSRVNDTSLSYIANELQITSDSLISFISEWGYAALDFSNFEVKDVNPVHLAMILRVTNSNRFTVKGWFQARYAAVKACEYACIDYFDVLYGMITREYSLVDKD